MIYLSIPYGMVFKKVVLNGIETDCFVDPLQVMNKIPLQELVKNVLRTNSGRKREIPLAEFTIYTRYPPNEDRLFLAYEPNQNGKLPSLNYELVNGREKQRIVYGHCSSAWFLLVPLSSSRRQEVEEARDEQRANRRHYGDSPCST